MYLREVPWYCADCLSLQDTLGIMGSIASFWSPRLENHLGLLAEEIWLTLQVLVTSI